MQKRTIFPAKMSDTKTKIQDLKSDKSSEKSKKGNFKFFKAQRMLDMVVFTTGFGKLNFL